MKKERARVYAIETFYARGRSPVVYGRSFTGVSLASNSGFADRAGVIFVPAEAIEKRLPARRHDDRNTSAVNEATATAAAIKTRRALPVHVGHTHTARRRRRFPSRKAGHAI